MAQTRSVPRQAGIHSRCSTEVAGMSGACSTPRPHMTSQAGQSAGVPPPGRARAAGPRASSRPALAANPTKVVTFGPRR
jgi:hypothetical protein